MELSEELRSELESSDLRSHPKFQITGNFFAKVVKVYDGDTVTVVMKPFGGSGLYRFQVRMYGYDSPELKPSKTTENRDDVVAKAKQARDGLAEKVMGKIVMLEVLPSSDKYGRLLCKMHCGGLNINEYMLESGYGYEYYGGKKE